VPGNPADFEADLFTLAFRKVTGRIYSHQPPGVGATLELKDDWGKPLANGIYYVVVQAKGLRWVEKLLILR
jgi:hypothetical protein